MEDFKLVNNFASLTIPLKLVDDFEQGLKLIKRQMDKMKTSLEPFAMLMIVNFITTLPTMITRHLTWD